MEFPDDIAHMILTMQRAAVARPGFPPSKEDDAAITAALNLVGILMTDTRRIADSLERLAMCVDYKPGEEARFRSS